MDADKWQIPPEYIAVSLMVIIFARDVSDGWYIFLFIVEPYYLLEMLIVPVLCFVGAAILMFTPHRSTVKTLIVTSLVFAVICLDKAYENLLRDAEFVNYDIINFITGTMMLACGLILLGNIVVYWTRASASLNGMLYSMIIILCLNIVDDLTMYRYGTDMDWAFQIEMRQLPMYALMVFNIILLRSDSVKVQTMLYNVMHSSDDIRRSAVPIGVKIDRTEIPKLQDIADSGLPEEGYEVYLNSFYPVDYRLVLARNGDRISVSFCPADGTSGAGIARFDLKGIWTDTGDAGTCDLVRIYGDDMFFIQMIVGGPYRKSSGKCSLREALRG